ncbi:hypothetical protein SIO70_23110 [Chitinophaga sancti]|uniref:hypothetical protein n=1 Tax=Chitinophaga sancti TaxID=1004 RepID=UPI002A7521C0|nr:hypothetical protein [Chitinophaga sancti]WPQ61253.1 hypothetical protein SIO70_23110 [Chitinophaga sancti]
MIKGSVRTFDFRFGDDFVSFLELAGRASVTLEALVAKVDGEDVTSEVIRFNYQDSVTKYKQRLQNTMYKAIQSLEGMVDEVYLKLEKLRFLAHFLVEIEACQRQLITQSTGLYCHKQFSFSNISEGDELNKIIKTEQDFQEHFFWMDHYLVKMYAFLLLLKEGIESTNQADFRVPPTMKPNPDESSQEKPFEYFDYLFFRNGIAKLRQAFMPSADDYFHVTELAWDKETETTIYWEQDSETGDWTQHKSRFGDKLFSVMYTQYQQSRSLIDDRISVCLNHSEAEFYVNRCVEHLKYFLKKIPQHKDYKKYDFLERFARSMIKYLLERYNVFCGKPDEIIEAVLKDSPLLPVADTPLVQALPLPNIQVFQVVGIPLERFVAIFSSHLKGICISQETSLEILASAFSGKSYETPLRIRWTCTARSKTVNKQPLFYLFKQLCDRGLIDPQNLQSDFLKRLHFVFVDADDRPLNNLPVSYSTITKHRKTEDQYRIAIDKMIISMLAVKSGKTDA